MVAAASDGTFKPCLMIIERFDAPMGYEREHESRYDLVDVHDLLNA
jgi:hypothetical protein